MSEYEVLNGPKFRMIAGGFDRGGDTPDNNRCEPPPGNNRRFTYPFALARFDGEIVVSSRQNETGRAVTIFVDDLQVGPMLVQGKDEPIWVFDERVERTFRYVCVTAERIGQRRR